MWWKSTFHFSCIFACFYKFHYEINNINKKEKKEIKNIHTNIKHKHTYTQEPIKKKTAKMNNIVEKKQFKNKGERDFFLPEKKAL